MRDWLGPSYGDDAADSPVHALERGEVEVPDFERAARRAADAPIDGRAGRGRGPADPDVRRLRARAGDDRGAAAGEGGRAVDGAAVELLGQLDYPREGWDELFDVVVISGEVGMRKPEARIFQLAADKLGPAPEAVRLRRRPCRRTSAAPRRSGMVGVHHVTPQQTIEELEALFGIPLRG